MVFDGVDDHGLVGDGAHGEDVVVGAGAGFEDGVVDSCVAEDGGFGGAGEVGREREGENQVDQVGAVGLRGRGDAGVQDFRAFETIEAWFPGLAT